MSRDASSAPDPLDQCRWPAPAEPYRTALVEAVRLVFARFSPAGIVATGTIVRDNPGPASDLDVYVVHREPWRQRLQRFFDGVPAEIFVNPPGMIARYFEQERREGRPYTAHMLATGFVVYDPEGEVERLRAQARELLARGPEPSDAFLLNVRYGTALALEDALDLVESDPEMCRALLYSAVEGAVRYRFWAARRWQPRTKERLRALEALDPDLGALARRFYRATRLDEQVTLGGALVRRSVGATGFFAWESAREPVGGRGAKGDSTRLRASPRSDQRVQPD